MPAIDRSRTMIVYTCRRLIDLEQWLYRCYDYYYVLLDTPAIQVYLSNLSLNPCFLDSSAHVILTTRWISAHIWEIAYVIRWAHAAETRGSGEKLRWSAGEEKGWILYRKREIVHHKRGIFYQKRGILYSKGVISQSVQADFTVASITIEDTLIEGGIYAKIDGFWWIL